MIDSPPVYSSFSTLQSCAANDVSATTLIEANVLPLSQTYHSSFSVPNIVAIFVWRPAKLDHQMQVGYEKKSYCQPISRFISEMIQDRAIVTVECQ